MYTSQELNKKNFIFDAKYFTIDGIFINGDYYVIGLKDISEFFEMVLAIISKAVTFFIKKDPYISITFSPLHDFANCSLLCVKKRELQW